MLQAKLSAVMETFTSVAVQKICKVFSYCFALNKTQFEGFKSYVNDDDVINVKALVKEHEKKPERKKRQAVRDVPGKTSCIYFNVTCKKIQSTVILTVVISFSSDSATVAPSVSLKRPKRLTVLPEETVLPQDSVKRQEVSSLFKWFNSLFFAKMLGYSYWFDLFSQSAKESQVSEFCPESSSSGQENPVQAFFIGIYCTDLISVCTIYISHL